MTDAVEVLPLGWSESGEPVSVPPGASGWRVKLHRPGAKKPALVRDARGIPTVIPLQATPDEFRAAVGVGGRYRLEPVFSDGRSIADSEPAIIILQEDEPKKATSNLGSNDALILRLIEGHHESIARTHELMNEMLADHRKQVTALAEQNTKLVTSMANNFGGYLSGTAKLLEASSPPPPPEPPRNALDTLGDFKKIRELCADLGDGAITGEPEAPPYAELVTEGVRTALPLLTQLIHKCVLGLSPEQTAALTGNEAPETPAASAEAPPAPTPTQPTTDFVAHLNAIEKHLSPGEAKTVRGVIATMSPEQIRAWKARIIAMPPDKAAAHVREQLQERKEAPS